DGFWPEPLNFPIERVCRPLAVRLGGLTFLGEAILETGIDQRHVDEKRIVRLAPPFASSGRERAERVAVIAEATRDHAAAAAVAALEMILARELQRRLDRFRSAPGEPHTIEVAGTHFGD